MRKHHPGNERIKRQYFIYLEEAKRMAPSSVDQIAAAIALFEKSTKYKDFKKFHIAQAIAFKKQIFEYRNPKTGKSLAKATIRSRLMALKAFKVWLAGRTGYRSRISYSDADYFNISANDERIAKAVRSRPIPSLAEICTAISTMPTSTILERRDRAIMAFTLLSGARDNAIASFSLRHVNLGQRTVFQDARDVRTKNAKTFTSTFFPVGAEYGEIIVQWIAELVALGFGPIDPLFPATKISQGSDRLFTATGLDRRHWKNAGAIRRIFKQAFESAGLPYYHPHSFRHTLARLGEKLCTTQEEWFAYSQNFGHSSPMTTYQSYGKVPEHRQAEIMNGLAERKPGDGNAPISVKLDDDQVRRILKEMAKRTAGEND